MREIVFDTETTGLSPADGDRITEIGCVEVIDFVPTGREYHCYVNPQRSLPPKVTEITGLTDEFLADKSENPLTTFDFINAKGIPIHQAVIVKESETKFEMAAED